MASDTFSKSVQRAADECFKAHKDASNKLDRLGSLEAAIQVIEDRHELLVASAYWLPPIPDHVRVNIKALLEHRPVFTQGMRKEFQDVVNAAKGRNRLRFRRTVDQAIKVVKDTRRAGEPRGYTYCRSDIILVLETLRSGEWDLRGLKIHYRRHRKDDMHEGLPGVEYR